MKKREHTRSGNLSGCFLASEELIIMVFAWGHLLSSQGKKNILPDSGNILNNGTIGSYVVYEPLAIILTAETKCQFFSKVSVIYREKHKTTYTQGKTMLPVKNSDN